MLCTDCLSGYREKAREVASEKDGVLILTWANHEYLDFVLNWLSHMERIKVTAYLVGAMDNNLLKVPSQTWIFASGGSQKPKLLSKSSKSTAGLQKHPY